MTLTIRKIDVPVTEELVNLSVEDSQLPFVGITSEIVHKSLTKPLETQWVIYSNDIAVGFFLLDQGYASTMSDAPSGAIGLRAYFIDKRYQGLGLAKASLNLITGQFHSWLNIAPCDLYLTVNCKNTVAYQLYQKVGFDDTGDLYLGGEAGPQHIMCFKSKKTRSIGL
ncbi:GNAT family N-acetyltransferase [Vibrio maritimus]|uniref:GNAT family N-acetyltransferase n=1 Tax=Vibrio chaetopteri TaxID=3016528 RepID=A0AAU8BFH1_9VIBR